MSLDYDLTGFLGAGSQMSWPAVSHPQPTSSTMPHPNNSRYQGHTQAASHPSAHSGAGHSGHGAGHQPATPKKQLVAHHTPKPFGEKAF